MVETANEFNRAKSKMAHDIRTVIADTEDLLKATAEVSGEGFTAARAKFEQKLGRARARMASALQPAVDKARSTAAEADAYVHESPWVMIGVAGAVGFLLGILASRR